MISILWQRCQRVQNPPVANCSIVGSQVHTCKVIKTYTSWQAHFPLTPVWLPASACCCSPSLYPSQGRETLHSVVADVLAARRMQGKYRKCQIKENLLNFEHWPRQIFEQNCELFSACACTPSAQEDFSAASLYFLSLHPTPPQVAVAVPVHTQTVYQYKTKSM